MEIYFDNAATTQCSPGVLEIMELVLRQDYGNPSSLHKKGVMAERHIRQAKERIAKTLKAKEQDILFTSGGTEANNLAIIGGALANRRLGEHVITTRIEHPAVIAPMRYLEEIGFRVSYLDVDSSGRIAPEQLRETVSEDTVLVSIMQVNNEIGAVEPIETAASMIKRKNPKTLFHVDSMQGYGKYRIHPNTLNIDLLTASAHKIHGPKGIGFLYVKEKTKLKPIQFGGGQQKGLRPGTENVPGIAGFGQAAMEAYEGFEQKVEHLHGLKERFLNGISGMEWAHSLHRLDQGYAPHILSVSFDGVKSEVLLHALEEKGIYVSSGSACAGLSSRQASKRSVSETLKAIGTKKEHLDTTLRFSFGRFNAPEEVDACLKALQELVPVLQRYTKR